MYNFETLKNKSPVKAIAKKISKKVVINTTTRDEDLFENLHNILLNPVRKSENDITKDKDKDKAKKKTKENL